MGYLLVPILVLRVLLVMPINGSEHELHFGIGLGRTHYHHPMNGISWECLAPRALRSLIKTSHNFSFLFCKYFRKSAKN